MPSIKVVSDGKLTRVLCVGLVIALLSPLTIAVHAWSNGGCSNEPSVPDYGTHDWIAVHALDFLPQNEKTFIENNLTTYLFATELPDCPGGIDDQENHHVYYHSDGRLQDAAAANRAHSHYQDAIVALVLSDFQRAARSAGIVSHYLSDVTVFGHVMDATTDWGNETHHSDYEDYVDDRTFTYDSEEFSSYLQFDGRLDSRTAYNATLTLAYDTTFDTSGQGRNATWMDQNYDWTDPRFKDRAGESINLAVNLLADVLHTLSQQSPRNEYSVVPYIVLGVAIVVIAVVVIYRRQKEKATRKKAGPESEKLS